jgi:uncharacterized protein YqhQ
MSKIQVGGQAVLEGVMMRAPGIMAVAVRRLDGSIEVHTDPITTSAKWQWLKKPFLRGILALFQSLVLGFRALNYSSAVAVADLEAAEAEKGQDKKTSGQPAGKIEKDSLSGWSIAGVIILTLVLGIGLFFLLPLYLTELMGKSFPAVAESTFLFNLVDGVIRVVFFVLYIFGIALMPDIRRIFQYHGAEHKSIFAYEAGLPLTLENAQQFSTLHPRCGTAFLLIVMVVAVFVFSLIPSTLPLWIKAAARILFLPIIASVSFELIKKAGDGNNKLVSLLIVPGLWLQRITTREPDESQLEVGLAALKTALNQTRESAVDVIV